MTQEMNQEPRKRAGLPGIALALAALLGAAACSSPRLVVASDLANPPFAWVDDAGEPRGRDVEMTQLLADALQRELVWRPMPFDQLLDAVESGAVDVAVATLGRTPEREARLPFTRTYYQTSISVVVRRGAGEPTTVAELAGRTVSAGRGTTSEDAAQLHLATSTIAEPSAKGDTSLDRLLSREVDALVLDTPNARALVDLHPTTLTLLAPPLTEEHYAIPVRKDDPALLTALNAALEHLDATGQQSELNTRHGLP